MAVRTILIALLVTGRFCILQAAHADLVIERLENQAPHICFTSPQSDVTVSTAKFTLEIVIGPSSGDVSDPWLDHNGTKVVPIWQKKQEVGSIRARTDVTLVEGKNCLKAGATTTDGKHEAEPAQVVIHYWPQRMHVFVVGVDRVVFGPEDAQAIAKLFERFGRKMYTTVRVTELLDEQATTEAIRKGMKQIARDSRPHDTAVVFMSGHAMDISGRYFFCPGGFRQSKGQDDVATALRGHGISADEITALLSDSSAEHRLLILDTGCSSKVVPVAVSKGISVIAGGDLALGEDVRHGALTYTLLAALGAVDRGPLVNKPLKALGSNNSVTVLEWFLYADRHAMELTQDRFGKEQRLQLGFSGANFPVLSLEK